MKYMIRGSYTSEGIHGLLREGGSSRRKLFQENVAALGGSVEAYYYALGDNDLYAIVDVPSQVDAVTLAMRISAGWAFVAKTTALVTPEEVDQAITKDIGYRPPGA